VEMALGMQPSLQLGNNNENPKTTTTAELCFGQGDLGSPWYEKKLLAPKVCPRNPSYVPFPNFVT